MNQETVQTLKDLSDLLEKDLISRSEFDAQKQLILKPQSKALLTLRSSTFFLRSISPQIVILILVFLFYFPLRSLVLNASEVGFGDVFAVKVEQALRLTNPALAQQLKGLTEEELIVMMSAGSSYLSMAYVDRDDELVHLNAYYPYYKSLHSKGLMRTASRNDAEAFDIIDSKEVLEQAAPYGDDLIIGASTIYYSIGDFTEEELETVDDLSMGLSTEGRDALRVIIEVTSKEISTLN